MGANGAEILLIEDNPSDVRLTKEVMAEAKMLNTLHVATDGEQALQFLNRTGPYADAPKPDLILLDLNLPRKDGREVLSVIKSTAALRRIPVVILTTSTSADDIRKTYDLHANCYITKPVDLDQFITVIKRIEGFWLNIVALPTKLHE